MRCDVSEGKQDKEKGRNEKDKLKCFNEQLVEADFFVCPPL
jgi:hypothetical protein